MKKKQTYKTDHPTIKEIIIGDKFILENGDIVEFIGRNLHRITKNSYPFIMGNISDDLTKRKEDSIIEIYTYTLNFYGTRKSRYDIKQKYLLLKDKIDLI